MSESARPAGHDIACMSEGICPDHHVPFAEYGQMFDYRPHRYRCTQCGPDLIWHATLAFGGSRKVSYGDASRLAWKARGRPG